MELVSGPQVVDAHGCYLGGTICKALHDVPLGGRLYRHSGSQPLYFVVLVTMRMRMRKQVANGVRADGETSYTRNHDAPRVAGQSAHE